MSKLKGIVYILCCWFLSFAVQAQNKYTLSGYVKDASSGETLIGATIFDPVSTEGVITNVYGYYAIALPEGTYTLEVAFLGYDTKVITVDLTADKKQDIELTSEGEQIEEIVVSSEAKNGNVTNIQMSVEKMSIETIKEMPSLLGEVEILRSILTLPGVSSVGEGSGGFNVRGGSVDQNLVLMDEAPVYNSSHLFGFFSVFNPDAVKNVELYKGGIPARYGGRLSSILDVRLKEGNNQNFEMTGGIGTIFSRLALEAPIVKDKASFIVAARRSYIDVLARPFLDEEFKNSLFNFYDLTFKTNYHVNDNNHLFLSAYLGRDRFNFGDDGGFSWGNSTASFRWNHIFSPNLFFNLTSFYSDYDYKLEFSSDDDNAFDWNARIKNFNLKPEFTYFINPKNTLRFGFQSTFYEFEPANASAINDGSFVDFGLDKKHAIESAAFLETESELSQHFKVNVGLRWSLFNFIGEGTAYYFGDAAVGTRKPLVGEEKFSKWENIKSYNNPEPRAALTYLINDAQSIKASYQHTAQYLHLISNSVSSTPLDLWWPSTNNIPPETANQYAIGYFQNFKDNTYEFSTEAYYKTMKNQVNYIDGADLFLNELVEADLLLGKGRAYGWELMLKKSKGKFRGWINYTLARTERLFESINNDEWFPSRFDQTHNLNLSVFYEFNDRWTLSSGFTYISGTPVTVANSQYVQQGYLIPLNYGNARNNLRIPAYHRLDVAVVWNPHPERKKKWKGNWVFSIYNLYGRKNPFSIEQTQQSMRGNPEAVPRTFAQRLSIIGTIIPSVTYNFTFKTKNQ